MGSVYQTSLNAYSRRLSVRQSCRPSGHGVKLKKQFALCAFVAAWALSLSLCAAGADFAAAATAGTAAAAAATIATATAATSPAGAAPVAANRDPVSCQNVRFSDVGWTDVTA